MSTTIMLGAQPLTLAALEAIGRKRASVALDPAVRGQVARGRAVVECVVARNEPAYGITTGVGSQKDFAVGPAEIALFNDRLIAAHATAAPGPACPPEVVRAALALQLSLFATGRSGIRPALLDSLLARLQQDDLPRARLVASVGASDIVPLSQLALPLRAGLQAKEALSLLNSNCLMLAEGALVLGQIRRLLDAATTVAALALEGFRGNPGAWSAEVDAARGQPGQIKAGLRLRAALAGSALWQPGQPRFLQDPLSLRCVPQIHGAVEAAYEFCAGIFETELGAICDNPMIELASGRFISHGNMESTLCALGMDTLRLAMAKLLEASCQRIHKIQWPAFTGLPQGLAPEGGASGGVQFLNLAHIATANLGAICQAAHPATLQYRGQVCDGVEDVGGMAPLSIAETGRGLMPAWNIVAVEAICACWAIERRDIPATSLGAGLRALHAGLRPLLPIGREGLEPFDMGVVVDHLKSLFDIA